MKLTKSYYILVVTILLSCSSLAMGKNTQNGFNAKYANQIYDSLSIKLSTQNLNPEELKKAVDTLESLKSHAQTCVDASQNQIDTINELLKSSLPEQTNAQQREDHKYLEDKKKIHEKHASECRLFVFRSQEAITAFKSTVQKLSKSKNLQRVTPIWLLLDKSNNYSFELNTESMYELSGLTQFNRVFIFSSLGILLIITILALYLKSQILRWRSQLQENKNGMHILLSLLLSYSFPMLILATLSLLLSSIHSSTSPIPTITAISYAFSFYIVILFSVHYCIRYHQTVNEKHAIPPELGHRILKRFIITSFMILTAVITGMLLRNQSISEELFTLVINIFMTFMGGLLYSLSITLIEVPFISVRHPNFHLLAKTFTRVFLISIIFIQWAGYHHFSWFILQGLFLTSLILATTFVIHRLMNYLLCQFANTNNYFSLRTRYYLGIKLNKSLTELSLISFTIYTIVYTTALLLLARIWGMSTIHIDHIQTILLSGFKFYEMTIIPSRIIASLFVFSSIFILGRVWAAHIAHRYQYGKEKERQVTIATIVLYITFAFAFILSLLVSGVPFTGLAIIAGALSVGIGFGLQNIVNNFTSGVILLLQKPIKPGDRVIVEGTEGFVNKIHLLFTRINTLSKEDVIIPNSDLLSKPVTNYMFRDTLWRVICQVGVAYGSNIELVKQVLLDVASKHPDVIQTPPNQPVVLFRAFGNSSLDFELWCIIHDVNKKYYVASDLNFSIDAAFRENNITISFPQRDLHIKNLPPMQSHDQAPQK